MKVAIITPSTNAYSETFIQAHIRLLRGEKVVYSGGSLPHLLNDSPIAVNLSFGTKVYRKICRTIGLIRFSDAQIAFQRSLVQEKPDVVLAEYGVTGAEILDIVKALQLPLVVHFHGYDASEKATLQKYQTKYLEMFAYAKKIVGVSIQMCNKLKELGCPPEKIIYSCYGPNDAFLQIKPNPQTFQFLAVGRFVEKKAPHLTILAFYKVLANYPNAKLRMAGEGHLKVICEDLVNALKINDSVLFLGKQTAQEIIQEMSTAFCFIQHSRTAPSGDMEGSPVGIIEAQAAALPVVSTKHAGIQDVVVHLKTGLLVNEGDVEEMAKCLLHFLDNPIEAKKMGKDGRERILETFTMDKHIETLNALLDS